MLKTVIVAVDVIVDAELLVDPITLPPPPFEVEVSGTTPLLYKAIVAV